MKREGKQHGMVRTYRILPSSLNPRPESKLINPLTSPPTAGLFTKVPSKPTNHSKFTGKCGQARCLECHMHPITKSKVKTKGSSKVRSNNLTFKMLTSSSLKLSGFSASGILDLLSDDYENDHVYESDEEEGENRATVVEETVNLQSDVEKEEDGFHDDDDDDDDEKMSFCDVGMMMDHVEKCDEEWYLVEDMII